MDYAVRITLAPASPAPTYTGGFWASGVAKLSGGATATGWTSGKLVSCSQVGESVDIAKGGNYAILSDCTVTLSAVGWPTVAAAGVSLHNATVEVGTLSGSTLAPRWVGYVSDWEWNGTEIVLTCESLAGRRHREIPARRLTRDEIPNLPTASEGSAVPIVWGAVGRMTPPKASQDRNYMGAFYQVSGGIGVERKATFAFEVPTSAVVKIATVGNYDGSTFVEPDTFWQSYQSIHGGDAYVEVSEGTGSGQTRRIDTIGAAGSTGKLSWYGITLDSAFSPQIDLTSVLRVFVTDMYVSVAVADEYQSPVLAIDVDGVSYPLISESRTVSGLVTQDVSDEFLSDNKFSAKIYIKPNAYGNPYLTDLISQTGSNRSITVAQTVQYNSDTIERCMADAFCCGYINVESISDADNAKEIDFLFSAAIGTYPEAMKIVFHATGEKYDGTSKQLISYDMRTIPAGDEWNAYSPGIATDGVKYNFDSMAVTIALPSNISSFSRIHFACTIESDDPNPHVRGGYVSYKFYSVADTDTTIRIYQDEVSWSAGFAPVVGDSVAIVLDSGAYPEYMCERTYNPSANAGWSTLPSYCIPFRDWRVITGVTDYGSGEYDVTVTTPFGVDATSSGPDNHCILNHVGTARAVNVEERECGITISYGDNGPSASIVASVESGREYSSAWTSLPSGKVLGDPITLASHAAMDMLLRDLGIAYADIDATSILATNARNIHAAIASPEMSSDIYARMCREFNWIAAHDSTGRETAKNWLGSIGAASQDYTVTNSDIIDGSLEGPQMTAIEDVVSLPTVSRSWTQADDFRAVGLTLSLDLAPASLTSANYLQYVPGWDSFAQADEAYAILHANLSRYGVEQNGGIEYQYTSDIQTQLIDDGLLHWISSRKEILEFSVRDNHAGAWATLGKRFAVTHRRYATSTKRGTLVARYWNPEKRTVQLTVMIDP